MADFISIQFQDRFFNEIVNNNDLINIIYKKIEEIESVINYEFEEGYNSNIKYFCNIKDYKFPFQRPLLINIIVEFLNQIFVIQLVFNFNAKHIRLKSLEQIQIEDKSLKQSKNKKLNPVILFHGMGISQLGYVLPINELLKTGRDLQIFNIGWVTIRLFNRNIPHITEEFNEFTEDFKKFIFKHHLYNSDPIQLAHSQGSKIIAWLINESNSINKYKSNNFITSQISSSPGLNKSTYQNHFLPFVTENDLTYPFRINNLMLIEPSAYCLHEPTAMSQVVMLSSIQSFTIFVIRTLISRDIVLTWLFFRKFKWYQNIITQDMLPKHTRLQLSEKDQIVNKEIAIKYLEYHQKQSGHKQTQLHVFKDLNHGYIVFLKEHFKKIIDDLKLYD